MRRAIGAVAVLVLAGGILPAFGATPAAPDHETVRFNIVAKNQAGLDIRTANTLNRLDDTATWEISYTEVRVSKYVDNKPVLWAADVEAERT